MITKKPRGFSLLELLISMGVACLIAGTCIFFARSSGRESSSLEKLQRYQQDRERLMIALRRDFRSCVSIVPEGKQTLLCVAQIGSRRIPELATVSYRCQGNRVSRKQGSAPEELFDFEPVARPEGFLQFMIMQVGSTAIVDLGFAGMMPKGFEHIEEKISLPNSPEEVQPGMMPEKQ